MKRLLLLSGFLAVLAAAYVASPFVAAWSIREAARAGDTEYLARKVDWERVKSSLGPSLDRLALGAPEGLAGQPARPPGLWQRVKARVGQSAVRRMIDIYITPEGLPKLFAYGKVYRETISGKPDEPRTLATLPGRVTKFWARVRRAEFKTPTRFELDLIDRHAQDRQFTSVFEFTGLQWKLVGLTVMPVPAAVRVVEAAR